jgi:hypothetical protein
MLGRRSTRDSETARHGQPGATREGAAPGDGERGNVPAGEPGATGNGKSGTDRADSPA